MLRIHKEGTFTLLLSLTTLVLLNVIFYQFFPGAEVAQWILAIVSTAFFFFLVSFFRNPKRKTVAQAGDVVAPADGKVVVIEETFEPEYYHSRRKQISIFMSPANVHVNRNPVGGQVVYAQYHPGKYLVAWHPKSSTENERTTIVIRNEKGEILIRQIAGMLARRIVNYLKVGQQVKQGEQFGFIKFGSRVDVFLPLNANVLISLNQPVTGGITIIANIP